MNFLVHADDIGRARSFYEAVFGWTFVSSGLPEPVFEVIFPAAAAETVVGASLTSRFLPGPRLVGFECTVEVESADDVAAAVVAHGGKILLEGHFVPGVGQLVRFEDPEGNVVSAIQHDYNPPQQ